jgi:hypothetical protein
LAQLALAMENTSVEPYELDVIQKSQKLAGKLNVQVSHQRLPWQQQPGGSAHSHMK